MNEQANLRRLARLLKALGHRDRLRIVAALAHQRACVCELTALLGLRQATVSQHLSMLRRAGAVRGERVGANVVYRITHPLVAPLLETLGVPVADASDGYSGVVRGERCSSCQQAPSTRQRPGALKR